MEWEEIKPPYRHDERTQIGLHFGGLFKIVQFQPIAIIKGVLYYNHGNAKDDRRHTIIYRSEQRNGRWSCKIQDILEINDPLSHEKAIEHCRLYCD